MDCIGSIFSKAPHCAGAYLLGLVIFIIKHY
jgi:hypothetical protein